MAVEEGWRRRFPHVALDREAIEQRIGAHVLEAELLAGGLRNTNYKVLLGRPIRPVVLRLYTADPTACAREVALLQLVHDRVPVPGVLQADPAADPPWALFEWIDGVRFDRMLSANSTEAVEQSCRSAGEVLAAIHAYTFAGPGMLGPHLEIAEPMGFPWLTGVEEFFASEYARQLVGDARANGVLRLVDREASGLEAMWSQSSLIHCDYKPWNLLVRQGTSGWAISAALDWEFSISGPPLCDIGIFLRYSDRMPPEYTSGLLDGYRAAGGSLPDDARNLARLIDLVSLQTFLERAGDDPAIISDVVQVLAATLDAFV